MPIRKLRIGGRYGGCEPWTCSACGKEQNQAPWSYVCGLACLDCIDKGFKGEPFVPLTVRMVAPKEKPEERAIVAVCVREDRCVTEQGEIFDLAGLVARIRERKPGETGRRGAGGKIRAELPERLDPCFIVTDAGLDLLSYLDQSEAADSPMWNWQASLKRQSAWRPEARSKSRAVFLEPKPIRFGYASRKGSDKRRAFGRARWYQLLDVHHFCELPGGWGPVDAAELLRFGVELRAWANREQLPVLTSASAYGGRLLKDARFGGGWRRKVPAATNAKVRAKLPGNHYQLLTAANMNHAEVHKLDQHAAHHYAALTTTFPHPDELMAEGRFRGPAPREGSTVGAEAAGGIRAFSRRWWRVLGQPGMFTLAIHVGERTAIDPLMIPALRTAGTTWQTVTSVELAHIRELRAQGHRIDVGDIWCCWTSPDVDERLNEYAWWASERIAAATPQTKRWMKPALLAAYGMLAVTPARFRNVWRHCSDPDGMIGFRARYGELIGYERSTKRERESQTANVLWRALIESSVRLESLSYARQLRADGFGPVAIYADAVFAVGDGTPDPPHPWRYEGIVHDLSFETAARYRSREETRLPGTRRREGWTGYRGGRQIAAPGPGR